jgi:hypothetical protein
LRRLEQPRSVIHRGDGAAESRDSASTSRAFRIVRQPVQIRYLVAFSTENRWPLFLKML